MKHALLALVFLSGVGCIHTKVQRLPAFNVAMTMTSLERPKLFFGNTVDKKSMPAMVPYAIINGISGTAVSTESVMRRIWNEAAELKADVVLVSNAQSVQAGTLHTHYGFGIATSEPIYQQRVIGVCFRICPGQLGFSTDTKGMVLVISEKSKLKQIGLLEGDRMLSINSVPLRPIENRDPLFDEYYSEVLKLKPDDEAKLVWIRPGTGRMSGSAKVLPNKGFDPSLPDAIPWKSPRRKRDDDRESENWNDWNSDDEAPARPRSTRIRPLPKIGH